MRFHGSAGRGLAVVIAVAIAALIGFSMSGVPRRFAEFSEGAQRDTCIARYQQAVTAADSLRVANYDPSLPVPSEGRGGRGPTPLYMCGARLARGELELLHHAAPLQGRDLTVEGVRADDDTATVRTALGAPRSASDSLWRYAKLDLEIKNGRVNSIAILEPGPRTYRGLQVGDSAGRALGLYRPCYSDDVLIQVCYVVNDFDERAIVAQLSQGEVVRINVGRIIEP